eukprot:CAMPEP_0181290804 /NCGR_PEP_ID=MMETSP1101-20121128/1611_1 /TAXON_ID=46948 /ORGANISM="Rhodomonas abbreviata, Strain Caron Lab Isolate" /LENGTH=217 /DNA_ID=CAMNT_0023395117 /DNA_START=104 /DNA_END=757 /DNA_ORIENTATION=-
MPSPDSRAVLPAVLSTARLRLRRFEPSDAQRLAELLNDRDMSRYTARVPFPYGMSDGEWFVGHVTEGEAAVDEGQAGEVVRAICLQQAGAECGQLVGAVGLVLPAAAASSRSATLGYWIGRDYWGRGIASEAVPAMLSAAATSPALCWVDCFCAQVVAPNVASCRVLLKIGFMQCAAFGDAGAGTAAVSKAELQSDAADEEILGFELSRKDALALVL